jgi:D-3-phosphoglycerate dehydrogenase
MHEWPLPESLKAVGRAGAGVNNIPVDQLTSRGIPVFNTPGANANAVKELVLVGMLMAARNIGPARDFVRHLEGTDKEITQQVESGKKRFVGVELPNRTLGVIGLGAIGVKVANAAIALGMRVIGYDPHITVTNAWQLASQVEKVLSVDDVLAQSDFVSLHVPLTDSTRGLIDAKRLRISRPGITLLNFSRQGIIDHEAVYEAINAEKMKAYVCDFPDNLLKSHPRVIPLPHLGASTEEAEENCAVMVADQIRDYLEHGTIRNSVNFPEMTMPRSSDGYRLLVVNSNVPHMIERISKAIANADINILDLLNRSRGEIACTLVDMELPLPQSAIDEIGAIEGVLRVRAL